MVPLRYCFVVVALIFWLGCSGKPKVTVPAPAPLHVGVVDEGVASWYGHPYHGRRTSSGEIYDMNRLTAAHQSLPFDTLVRVTNLENGRSVEVRINDRGPFVKNRLIDLSRAAAKSLGMIGPGTANVRLEVIGQPGSAYLAAQARTVATTPPVSTPVSYTPAAPAVPVGLSEAGAGEAAAVEEEASLPADPGVAPQSAPAAAEDGAQCPGGPFYAVQVGSFRDTENAERMRGKMADLYGVAHLLEIQNSKGTLYRVVVGQQGDAQSAQRLLDHLGRDHYDGLVLRVDPTAVSRCL